MAFIQVPPDSTGKLVDTAELTDGADTVARQKIVLAGGSGTAEVVVVTNAAAGGTDMGLVVRHAGTATIAGVISGTVNVNGGVAISGTATVAGNVNISTMPEVVIAAGANNIGTINNISAAVTVTGTVNVNGGVAISGTATVAGSVVISGTATVAGSVVISGTATVAGVVGLTAGTANIGFLDHVSRTVQVAIATPYILQGISTTVLVAVSTPFTINNISATSIVAGVVGLTAGTANIGSINNVSATVLAAVKSNYVNTAAISASRGPKTVVASTSSNVTLAAAPGAGMAIYVTGVMATNASGTNTQGRFGTSGSVATVMGYMAQSGGGYTLNFTPPWRLSTNEALMCSVKPNASEGYFMAHFFVASADAL